jgi:predicted  nucleic acid-binding Zn-ribbon protein
MSEFLEFLNSADEEALLKIDGMTKTLAKRLTGARPIETNEDLVKLKGMDIKLFSRLQAGFLEHREDQIEEAVERIEAEEEQKQPEKKPTRTWVKVLRWILIILILLGAVYAAIIYGVPFIYKTFLAPVESNAARLEEINTSQSAVNKELEGEITALQDRVATLEARADAVDETIAGLTASIDTLNTLTGELDASVDYRVTLSRSIDTLSRARLYLSQSNSGLARADVLTARNLLLQLSASAPESQSYAMNEAINNLDLALANLPAYPAVAVYYVDIAWQYLVDGMSAVQPTVVPPDTAPTEVTLTPTTAVTPAP